MPDSPPDVSRDQLTGWKDIAAYLGKSVRTVQRWEQKYALPVHRVPGSAEVVLASKDEIERWKRSEASLDIPDLDRPDLPSAVPRRHVVYPRARWLTISAIVTVAAVLLAVHLSRRQATVEQAAAEDDAALFVRSPYALQWQAMVQQQTPLRRPDGVLVDPGFVTFEPRTVIFEYVKAGGVGRARPYVFARLEPAPESPRLRFSYVPHADARISHWAGFADESGFVRKGEEPIGYWVPRTGVALRLDRTSKSYVNSRAGLWTFVGGEPRAIAPERPLRFQFEPGRRYECTMEIEGWRVSASVSDGARVEAFMGTVDSAVPADVVFIADAHDGVSTRSPQGRYPLRFEDISVRDALYQVTIALLTSPNGSAAPAAPRPISLVIQSSRNVDATSLDQSSLRLSGAGVLRGDSRQGFACRSGDKNGDGVFDLICDFDAAALKLDSGQRQITLLGRTTYGHRVGGRLSLPGRD